MFKVNLDADAEYNVVIKSYYMCLGSDKEGIAKINTTDFNANYDLIRSARELTQQFEYTITIQWLIILLFSMYLLRHYKVALEN